MHGKTFIIVNRTFLTDFVLEPLCNDPRYEVLFHSKKKSPLTALLRLLKTRFFMKRRSLWSRLLFDNDYLARLHSITPADRVILWDVKNMKDIMLLSCEINASKTVSFLWDSMRIVGHGSERRLRRYPEALGNIGVETFTFDRGDAERFGFRFAGQVFRAFPVTATTADYDISYVGSEKGREAEVNAICEEADREGLSRKIMIFPARESHLDKYPALKGCGISSRVSYTDNLELVCRSRCLLDILQDGQQGVTLRMLEAMYLGKKLITNNPRVKEEEFYNPANIYILGDPESERRSLREFIESPADPVDPEIINRHEIKTWITQFNL